MRPAKHVIARLVGAAHRILQKLEANSTRERVLSNALLILRNCIDLNSILQVLSNQLRHVVVFLLLEAQDEIVRLFKLTLLLFFGIIVIEFVDILTALLQFMSIVRFGFTLAEKNFSYHIRCFICLNKELLFI